MLEHKIKKLLNSDALFLKVYGTIQGVGLRPAIHHLANRYNLGGYVKNCGDHVEIHLEGSKKNLLTFKKNLTKKIPPHAKCEQILEYWRPSQNFMTFTILKSNQGQESNIPIPPDLVFCQDCLTEYLDPLNPRYLYPFNACTNCGPRYSIIEKLPYDRCHTSLKNFPLCGECEEEFNNPLSRRFHTQNFACNKCGPFCWVSNSNGEKLNLSRPQDIIYFIHQKLKEGAIFGIKGLGGFQFVCEAKNLKAIKKLREKKHRPHQSMAIMVRNKELLKESENIINLMEGPTSPIVITTKNYELPQSPDTDTQGIFLPTTLLHQYLFGSGLVNDPFDYLVVTSGNNHGEPMVFENEKAIKELSSCVDYFLMHDRPILRNMDDSIIFGETQMMARRARGFAPDKIILPTNIYPSLAMGGDMKNTFAFGYDNKALLSPHNGNLYSSRAYELYSQSINHLLSFLNFKPKFIITDKHPHYLSSSLGKTLANQLNIPVMQIQHHRAHAAAVMAEHHLPSAICICFDGSGYGDDKNIWGGECFLMDFNKSIFKRVISLTFSKLIGGEKAITSPVRQTIARILELKKKVPLVLEDQNLINLYNSSFPNPLTSSMGRLFDSISALLMPRYHHISYEGQAAIGLETLALKAIKKEARYSIKLTNSIIDTTHLFAQIFKDYENQIEPFEMAWSFHLAVVQIIQVMVEQVNSYSDFKNVCLSGGVFSNQLLMKLLIDRFKDGPYKLFWHHQVPTGDGGISLGQLYLGNHLFQKGQFNDA